MAIRDITNQVLRNAKPVALTYFQIGTRIHCGLYGGRDGIVFAIHGKQRPDTVRTFAARVGVAGGAALFDIVFEDGSQSLRLPEAVARGVQWRVLDGIASADEIAQALTNAARVQLEAKARIAAAAAAHVQAVAVLKQDPAKDIRIDK